MYLKTDIAHGRTDVTLLDGHGLRTHIGMPNWNREISQIKKAPVQQSNLFYCGRES